MGQPPELLAVVGADGGSIPRGIHVVLDRDVPLLGGDGVDLHGGS